MFKNFKLLFLPLDGGGKVGVKAKATHPPFVPPIKGGKIFLVVLFYIAKPNLMI